MHTLIDSRGIPHTIATGSAGLMLESKPCRLLVKDARIELISVDPDIGTVIVTPAALWHAFAGGDPTPESAGLMLAEALARWTAIQEMALLALRLRPLIDEIDLQVSRHGKVPLPSFSFDSFTLQLLRTYDGTQEHIGALARLLKQQPATILTWLAESGLILSAPAEGKQADGTASSPEPAHTTVSDDAGAPLSEKERAPQRSARGRRAKAPPPGKRPLFRWTPAMIEQLTAAFLTSSEPHIGEVARAIAEQYGWPAEGVEYKIYHLGLPRWRESQRGEQDQDVQHDAQDQGGDYAAVPLPVQEEEVLLEQDEEVSRLSPLVIDGTQPVALRRGNFLWNVQVDGRLQRWELDYAYGQFPVADGQQVKYHDQVYCLQQACPNLLRLTTQEESPVSDAERSPVC